MLKENTPTKAAKLEAAEQLKIHLEALGIKAAITDAGYVSVRDSSGLLKHLTDEEFTARTLENVPPRKGPPVPVHRVDNPVGALLEWSQGRGSAAKPPVFSTSENIGDVHAPQFSCTVTCDGETTTAEQPNKVSAKRKAAQQMLNLLSERYGAERQRTPA